MEAATDHKTDLAHTIARASGLPVVTIVTCAAFSDLLGLVRDTDVEIAPGYLVRKVLGHWRGYAARGGVARMIGDFDDWSRAAEAVNTVLALDKR